MLMTAAAVHMDSAHGHGPPPSSSTSLSAPPWLPVVLADDNHRQQLLRHFTASSAPSSPPATASPPNHHQLRTAATATRRGVAKRRPRPSRKLPTTYITADPASFRRMVHQVTGADDLPLPVAPPEGLCRPAPYRAGAAGALVLPTLDTSAFLLGSAAAPAVDRAEAGGRPPGGACNYSSSSSCGGFPTLDSWDAHLF